MTLKSRALMGAALAVALGGFAGISVPAADDRRYVPIPTRKASRYELRDPKGLKQRRKNNKAARKARAKNRGK